MLNPNYKTGEAGLGIRSHLFYNGPEMINEFMARAMFENAPPAAPVAAPVAIPPPVAEPKATPAPVDAPAGSIMDDAAKEAKVAEDVENKRLMDAKEEDLNEADKLKKAELIKKNKAAEAAKGVPEKYEFKAPEGFTIDQALVDKFTPVAKELELSQENAQKLVDLYSGIVTASKQVEKETFDKFVEGLKTETIKELGANYKQELAFAAKTRDRFASKELVEKLNESGLANDKDMIKLFIAIGKAVSEDNPPLGPAGGGGPKTAGEVLFPSANKG